MLSITDNQGNANENQNELRYDDACWSKVTLSAKVWKLGTICPDAGICSVEDQNQTKQKLP